MRSKRQHQLHWLLTAIATVRLASHAAALHPTAWRGGLERNAPPAIAVWQALSVLEDHAFPARRISPFPSSLWSPRARHLGLGAIGHLVLLGSRRRSPASRKCSSSCFIGPTYDGRAGSGKCERPHLWRSFRRRMAFCSVRGRPFKLAPKVQLEPPTLTKRVMIWCSRLRGKCASSAETRGRNLRHIGDTPEPAGGENHCIGTRCCVADGFAARIAGSCRNEKQFPGPGRRAEKLCARTVGRGVTLLYERNRVFRIHSPPARSRRKRIRIRAIRSSAAVAEHCPFSSGAGVHRRRCLKGADSMLPTVLSSDRRVINERPLRRLGRNER